MACIGLSFLLAISCHSDPPSEGPITFDMQLSAILAEDSLGWAYWEAAEAALNRAQSKEADSLYQLAANAYGHSKNSTGEFWAHAKRAEMLAGRTSQDSIINILVNKLEIQILQISSEPVAFWAHILLQYTKGLSQYGTRPYADSSHIYLNQLIATCETYKRPKYEALLSQLYFLLGDVHFQQLNQPNKAASYLEQSLILAMRQTPNLALSNKTLIYGWVKEHQGEYEYATRIQQFTLALRQYFLGHMHIKVANVWNHLGNCQYEKQTYEDASEAYAHARDIMGQSGKYPFHEIIFQNNLAATLEQLGQTDSLEDSYLYTQSLIDRYLDSKSKYFGYYQVLNYQNLSAYYIDQKSYIKAEFLLYKASQLAAQQGNSLDLVPAHTEVLLAELYYKQGRYQAAEQSIKKAKRLADVQIKEKQIQVPEEIEPGLVLDLFALSARILFDVPDATLNARKQALIELHRLFQFAQQQRSYLSIEEDQLHTGTSIQDQLQIAVQLAYDLFQETGNTAYLQQAFSLMELSKSQVLQQELTRQTRAAREQRHRGHILSLKQGGITNLTSSPVGSFNKLVTEQAFLQQLILRVHEEILVDTLQSKKVNRRLSIPTSITKIQNSLLQPGELLLTYMVTNTILWELSISDSREYMRPILRNTSILQQTKEFQQAIFRTDLTDMATRVDIIRETGYQLAEQLLLPACRYHFGADSIPVRIHIVPDAELIHFPFELLPTDRRNARYYQDIPYLIRAASINYGFSAALLTPASALIDQNKAQKNFLTLVGLDDTNVDLDIEVPTSFKHLALSGLDATKAQFSRESPHHNVLQILAHGFADDKKGSPFMLLQGAGVKQSDTLFSHEISILPLEAELVVLTACDGALGQLIIGEGSFSLLRAFKMAGARSLVGGLWKVRIAPLSSILTHFYAGYSQGIPTDEALRRAKLTYLDNASVREADPAIWGSLVPFNQIIVNQ